MKGKSRGYIMAGVGFILILITALSYLLNWDGQYTPLFILGIVFVAVGMNMTRKSDIK
ncbi:MAG: hypothetical protein HKN68_14715 [Saprospiraceae bacterium]|nr:hypothetical protein [Saprospiraceae bacterium]